MKKEFITFEEWLERNRITVSGDPLLWSEPMEQQHYDDMEEQYNKEKNEYEKINQ